MTTTTTTTATTTPRPGAGDDHDHDDKGGERVVTIRPRLDEQLTPAGVRRRHPIAMVMIRGRDAYEQLGAAQGVGVRRRYFIEVQGLRGRQHPHPIAIRAWWGSGHGRRPADESLV